MNSYIFVFSAIISVISVYLVFMYFIRKTRLAEVAFETIQKEYLIGMLITNILPTILLVFGIIKMTPKTFNEILIPISLILVFTLLIFLKINQEKQSFKEDTYEAYLNYLLLFTRPMLFSIPFISIVFLYLMTFS